jgi:hypothetical protein
MKNIDWNLLEKIVWWYSIIFVAAFVSTLAVLAGV